MVANFICEKCGAYCWDTPRGYITGCEHHPPDARFTTAEMEALLDLPTDLHIKSIVTRCKDCGGEHPSHELNALGYCVTCTELDLIEGIEE